MENHEKSMPHTVGTSQNQPQAAPKAPEAPPVTTELRDVQPHCTVLERPLWQFSKGCQMRRNGFIPHLPRGLECGHTFAPEVDCEGSADDVLRALPALPHHRLTIFLDGKALPRRKRRQVDHVAVRYGVLLLCPLPTVPLVVNDVQDHHRELRRVPRVRVVEDL